MAPRALRSLLLLFFFWGALAVNPNSEEFGLRLVGGQSRCQGELQLRRSGLDWTEVRPWEVPLSLGNRVCAALGCGSALSVEDQRVPVKTTVRLFGSCENASLISCFEAVTHRSDSRLELICSESVRLVSGQSVCSGLVQIRDQTSDQSWTSLCEGALDRRGAEVLCKELDCGAPLLQGALSAPKPTFRCEGHEFALKDCPRDQTQTKPETCTVPLHLTCSEPLRLVGGAGRCEGTPELRYRGQWRRVWSTFWQQEAADAVCRDLGCGSAVSVEQRRDFNISDLWVVDSYGVKTSSVRDSFLWSSSAQNKGLVVVCHDVPGPPAVNPSSEELGLRLVGGQSRCQGELQLRRSGLDWTEVRPWEVPLSLGNRVCAALGCGSALSVEDQRVPVKTTVRLFGSCENASLISCFEAVTHRSDSRLELICSESVRLVSGRSTCSGRVQIRDQTSDQSWTSLCEGALDHRGAEVLCRKLDCGPPLLQGALSALKPTFYCEGHESALKDCSWDQTRTEPETCTVPLHLTCSEPLRLVGGAGRCEGTPELRYRGQWRRVWSTFWQQEAADAVCRDLGCGSAVSVEQRRDFNISDLWVVDSYGVKTSSVRDSFLWGSSAQNKGLVVVCHDFQESFSLRLVGGRGRCQGQLQVRTSGQDWAEVAPVLVTLSLGNRICAHLGCGSALRAEQKTALRRRAVHLYSAHCNDTSLLSCFDFEEHHSDAGLELDCSESVRLVPGQTSCSGWVQFRERPLEQWRPLCQEEVDSRGAEVLCRELRCGAPLLQGALSPLGQTFHCEGSESALMDCPRNQTRTDPETCSSLSITCAGHQGAPEGTEIQETQGGP